MFYFGNKNVSVYLYHYFKKRHTKCLNCGIYQTTASHTTELESKPCIRSSRITQPFYNIEVLIYN